MNFLTFSFVLVTLIDSVPLNKKPEVLMESMESNGSKVLMDSTNSSAQWWLWGDNENEPPYEVGTKAKDPELREHLVLKLYGTWNKLPVPFVGSPSFLTEAEVLTATIDPEEKILATDTNFSTTKKTIIHSHGYKDDSGVCENKYVTEYLALDPEYQIVCIDWSHWAHQNLANVFSVYRVQAQASVDVGNYLGRFLKKFVDESEIDSNNLHLIGHSLGAHIVGHMGRVFTELSEETLPRVTGLDPAGPLFERDAFGLKMHMIKKSDATFVDIMHTCGSLSPSAFTFGKASRLGDLHQLGHADFYPNGGSIQPGCGFLGTGGILLAKCSHGKAQDYYVESINAGVDAFATVTCDDVYPGCEWHHSLGDLPKSDYNGSNHMGFYAVKPENPTLYYLDTRASAPFSHCCA
jgi:hypothetical protein